MKLSELKKIVDFDAERELHREDREVVIAIKLPYTTVGPIPTIPIKSVRLGFDWERGKYILTAEEELMPADRDFASKMKDLQERLGFADLDIRRLKAENKRLKKQIGVEE